MNTKQRKTRAEYDHIQAIRAWNAKFHAPPVCTAQWTDIDFQAWIDARKPLPPFEEWEKQ